MFLFKVKNPVSVELMRNTTESVLEDNTSTKGGGEGKKGYRGDLPDNKDGNTGDNIPSLSNVIPEPSMGGDWQHTDKLSIVP